MAKYEEPAVGIPYNPAAHQAPMPQQFQQQYYVGENPYQAGMVPPNAIYGDPKGIPIQQTIYRDTPAPFNCLHCGNTGLTQVNFSLLMDPSANTVPIPPFFIRVNRSKPSPAAFVGCMMPFMLGVCFLCPSMDCLWHKYHYCPSCNQKVADFEKSDFCLVMDPPNWEEKSFALPA